MVPKRLMTGFLLLGGLSYPDRQLAECSVSIPVVGHSQCPVEGCKGVFHTSGKISGTGIQTTQ